MKNIINKLQTNTPAAAIFKQSNKISEIQTWKKSVFDPWKEQMEELKVEQKEYRQKIKAHAGSLKHMVALLCENKGPEVVDIWNSLGLNPVLSDVSINYNTSEVTMQTLNGKKDVVQFDALIGGLKTILEA